MKPVASIQIILPLQDNDFDELCEREFLLMIFLYFYFHGSTGKGGIICCHIKSHEKRAGFERCWEILRNRKSVFFRKRSLKIF